MKVASGLMLLLVLTACGNSSSTPVAFELRDLSISKSNNEFSTEFTGSASLVSNDQRLKGRTVMVLLQWKSSIENGSKQMLAIPVKDGTGLVKLYDFSNDKNAATPVFSDWETLGYYELAPATVMLNK